VNSFGPRSCYDEGKRVAEALAYAYRLQHEVDIRIARIFNAYGPGMLPDDGRVVPNFIIAALAGREIEITGDGNASRCFQFVTDCTQGLIALMNSPCESPVNIGSDHETSIKDLAETISDIVARKTKQTTGVPLKFTAQKEDDPFRRQPDIRLAKEKLGWEPKIDLAEGLEASVDWFLSKI
jgi:UDP-glucuronate decarboxylase